MQVTAIILAAGKGERMGLGFNKVFATLQGKPVLAHSLMLFEQTSEIHQIIVVAAKGELETVKKIAAEYHISKATNFVEGGSTRFRSVAAALPYISCTATLVAVHDGARPLLKTEDLQAVLRAAEKKDGAILAAPVQDTIKEEQLIAGQPSHLIGNTLNRNILWRAFTPQVFPVDLFLDAYTRLDKNVTDDAALVESLGAEVLIVPGDVTNIKITTPMDLKLAELLLAERG